VSKHRQPKLFPDNVSEEQILETAGALGTLTVQPGWAVWEALVRESREASLEDLATSPPDKVLYWQGYAAALGAVMNAPSHLLDQARAVQEEQAERDGTMNDRVRVGLHDADPSV
jgi:hypothetical protein